MSINLYRMKKTDLERGVEVLVRAFHEDPLTHYFFPPCDNWGNLVSKYFAFRLRFGIKYGEVYASSSEIEGLAAWFAPGKSDMTNFRMMRVGGMAFSREMGPDILERLNMIGEYTSRMRKQHVTEPPWHLFPIAVEPEYRGTACPRPLMRSMLDRITGEGLPCYLETQKETNLSLYIPIIDLITYTDIIPGITMKHWGMLLRPNQ